MANVPRHPPFHLRVRDQVLEPSSGRSKGEIRHRPARGHEEITTLARSVTLCGLVDGLACRPASMVTLGRPVALSAATFFFPLIWTFRSAGGSLRTGPGRIESN